MRPVIGITTSINEDETFLQMNLSYITAIENAGGVPVLLPPTEAPEVLARYTEMIDGLLLSGGDDIDPMLYGENQQWECGGISAVRDAFELRLCRAVLAKGNKPILGICRGMQLLNVALNGSLYQDLQSHHPGKTLAHRQKQRSCYPSHRVSLCDGTLLQRIFAEQEITVNSHHHQAVNRLGSSLIVSALAPDGVVEGIECPEHRFCVAVQWHPERLCNQPDAHVHALLFKAFVEAAAQ